MSLLKPGQEPGKSEVCEIEGVAFEHIQLL